MGTEVVVRSLAVDLQNPQTLWIGLSGQPGKAYGIFKADSSGKPWVCAYQGQHYDKWSVAVAPSKPAVIYAASDAHQIMRSVDGGENWTEISGPDQVEAIAIDPVDPLVVYAALDGGWGLSRTRTAGGGGWESLLKGQDLYLQCVAVAAGNPSLIFVGARDVNSPNVRFGVFRTTDGGESWKLVFPDKDVMALAVDPANARTIYAGSAENGLWRSLDGGETWQKSMQGITHPSIGAIAVGSVNPRVVYAGTRGDGVFRSEDGGDSWQPMNDGLTQLWVTALALNPRDDSQLYVGTNSGVYAWRREEVVVADAATPKPAGVGLSADSGRDLELEAAYAAMARERRGKIIGAILLVAAVAALLWLFVIRKGARSAPAEARMLGPELKQYAKPAMIAGFIFTGIYAMAGLYLLTTGRGELPKFTGTWALADAGLFLTGSLLARQGRFRQARVIWLIAGYAGIPLGLVMVGFANYMNAKIKAADRQPEGPVAAPAQPNVTVVAEFARPQATAMGGDDPLKRACKQEIMRFLTAARTRQHEERTGARWCRNDLLLTVTKAGLDKGKSPEVFFTAANAAVDELASEKAITGTDSGYRAP